MAAFLTDSIVDLVGVVWNLVDWKVFKLIECGDRASGMKDEESNENGRYL